MTDWTSVFADYAMTTKETYLGSGKKLLNEASTRTILMSKALKGSANRGIKTLQGGKEIREQLFLGYEDIATEWAPDDDILDIQNPQFISEHGIPWRFTASHISWTDPEVELQADSTADGMYRRIKEIYQTKEQHAVGQLMEHMDGNLTATPSHATMEATGARKQYSFTSAITEENSGGVPTIGWSGTSYQGIDTATEPNWRNQTSTYDYVDGKNAGSDSSLFEAFDDMMFKTQFEQYPDSTAATPSEMGPSCYIVTSRWGKRAFMSALRASNEMLVATSRQDPAYLSPAYAGRQIQQFERLGTQPLYDDGSSGYAAEDAADTAGPRFYFWNTEYLCPIFHSNRYFMRKKPGPWPNQPFRSVIWIDTWWNLMCRSKRRQGIVSPSADITASNGVAA